MKYGDKVIIHDGSRVDGCTGIVYHVNEETILVLLDKEVFWPVRRDRLVLEKEL